MFASIDAVMDKVHHQIDHYKGKRWSKRAAPGNGAEVAEAAEAEAAAEEPSRITRVKRFAMVPMDEEEAVDQMELLGHDFFVFFNVNQSQLNVVYRQAQRGLRPNPARSRVKAAGSAPAPGEEAGHALCGVYAFGGLFGRDLTHLDRSQGAADFPAHAKLDNKDRQCPPQGAIEALVQALAAPPEIEERLRAELACAGSSMMHDHGCRLTVKLPAGPAHAPAPVHLLRIQEVAAV